MKVGDLVHNVPYDTLGMITSELKSITTDDGQLVERRFMVLYSKPLTEPSHWGDNVHVLTGSTYLIPAEHLCRHLPGQKCEGERCC